MAPLQDFLKGRKAGDFDEQVVEWKSKAQSVATQLLEYGMSVAALVASLASLIPAYFGYFITSDAVVQNAVSENKSEGTAVFAAWQSFVDVVCSNNSLNNIYSYAAACYR